MLILIPPLGGIEPWIARPAVTLSVGEALAKHPMIRTEHLVNTPRGLEVQHLGAGLLHIPQRLGEAAHAGVGVKLRHLLTLPLVDTLPACRVQKLGVRADAAGVVKQTEPVVGQHTIEPNHLVMPGLPWHDQLAGEGCGLRHPRRAEVVVQRVWLRIHEVRLPAGLQAARAYGPGPGR